MLLVYGLSSRRHGRHPKQTEPALATRRWSSKAIWMRSGWLRGSIYRVLLFWDRFSVSKPLSQIQRRTLLFLQQASYTPSFGGLGLRDNAYYGDAGLRSGKSRNPVGAIRESPLRYHDVRSCDERHG